MVSSQTDHIIIVNHIIDNDAFATVINWIIT